MKHSYQVSNTMTPEQIRNYVIDCDRDLEQRMRQVALEVAATPQLRLIGLTGPTCSGKTTTAKILTGVLEAAGHRVHVISIDDFYYDKAYLEARADAADIEIDYDSEDTIDIDLLEEKAASLLRGDPTVLPRFDFPTGARVVGPTIDPEPTDVFLFEGIQVLYPKVDAILRRREGYRSIYIRAMSYIYTGSEEFDPNEIRLMRRLVRDHLHRATDAEFTFYVWKSVRDNEEKSIFPYASSCDCFIDSTMPYEIGMLKPYLEEILSTIKPDSEFYDEACDVLRQLKQVQAVPCAHIAPNSLYKEFI